ncbi:MAG: hypothetical protein ABI702_12160 [Burkholderiales bacterium]
MHTPTRHAQRGTTLLEALVAFLVLSLGMIGLARVQSHLRLDSDVARQRSEATRLAQEDMETLRGFATTSPAAGMRSFDAIASASRTVSGVTAYQLDREVAAADAPQAKLASITVSWVDRSGGAQQIVLHSIIAGADPVLSSALALASSPP